MHYSQCLFINIGNFCRFCCSRDGSRIQQQNPQKVLIFKFFFSSFSATRYNLNTQKLLNLRKSYVPIVLSVTPDNFWRHRNHLFHGTQNHQNSVVSVDSAPYPGRAESTESTYFGIFSNLAKILNFSVVSVDSAVPG